VITCRRQSDRGRWRWSEAQRQSVLRTAIVFGAEYVDLEMDVAGSIPRYGATQRIVSHHDFEATPDNLEEIYAECAELDPDIIKIATMANAPADMVRMLKLVYEAEVPTIGFCMGELGMASRILCGKYGAPFTYASFSKERELAPGQLSFEEMKGIYRFDTIDADTEVYGVLGDPIGHSLSPLIHNAAFRREKRNAVYLPFRVPKDLLKATLDEFEWLAVQGYSVTIPHKEAVLAFADRTDGPVQEIGAANTLYRDRHGHWLATNTDYEAALASIRLGLESGERLDDTLSGKKVLLLGAGGAARAIGLGVVRAGGLLTVSNRTHKRAQELASALGCQQIQWENRGTVFADVLINCTPVGMHPNVDETPYEQHWIREGMLVFDTIYNPENTLLLKNARERGCRTVSGVEMFVRQAAAQYECFLRSAAPLETMRAALRYGISPLSSIL
jgi:3-dehydroquinate dehydratase/shikimate dehydrogenase